MQEAVNAKEQANLKQKEYNDKLQSLSVAQAEMAETIRKEAEDQRDILLAQTRQELERERASWTEHIDEEKRNFTSKLHRTGAKALLALTGKALTDLADQTLEERMAHTLVRQISPMASDLRQAAGQSMEAVVTSHNPLPKSGQDALLSELKEVFPDVSVRFDTDEDQSPGIVLRIGGAQLAWTIDTYLDKLDETIDAQLASNAEPKAQSDAR
jgi:F-type H+-transporting ATPase subunit b